MTEEQSKQINLIKNILSDNNKFIVRKYTQGKCYIFAKIIEIIIPETKLYLSKELEHCIFYINGKYYDANGIVPKNTIQYYKKFADDDIYCLKNYNARNYQESILIIKNAVNEYLKINYNNNTYIRLNKYIDKIKKLL